MADLFQLQASVGRRQRRCIRSGLCTWTMSYFSTYICPFPLSLQMAGKESREGRGGQTPSLLLGRSGWKETLVSFLLSPLLLAGSEHQSQGQSSLPHLPWSRLVWPSPPGLLGFWWLSIITLFLESTSCYLCLIKGIPDISPNKSCDASPNPYDLFPSYFSVCIFFLFEQ